MVAADGARVTEASGGVDVWAHPAVELSLTGHHAANELFAIAARRMDYSTLGFIQFLAPTLVFDRHGLYAVLGSPGGSQIPNFVSQALIGLLDERMDAVEVVAQARVGSRNGPLEVEQGRLAPAVLEALEARGHGLREVEMTSGIALIVRQGRGWVGAADPRREGTAGGD